ncbi:DNA polymerase III subunit alpha [Solilutibacter silvestris]|uniref:DNA polymerase III subunit alpha n=1 Tax=Solilutibacter silvestris TaxID=1645665 RepID=UPI003D334753
MSARFAHLQLHSEYSLVDSTIRLDGLVRRCVELGLPAVAITDRNNLFALVKFYKLAEGAGLKPIAGADLTVVDPEGASSQLTLLCRDHDGYLALSRLLTRAWMHGHRQDGVGIDSAWLDDENLSGLFALAGRDSSIGAALLGGRDEHAQAEVERLQRLFGDRLNLALARTQRPHEDAFNAYALHLSGQHSIPVVASNDVRFLDSEDFDAHEARVCIATGRVLDDPKRPRLYSPEQSLKSGEAMAELFADIPDAIDNAFAIAECCNLELRLGTYYLPAFPVPSDETLDSWIRGQSHAGLRARLEQQAPAEGHDAASYRERLDRELDVIIKMGFPGYFLIVADFINWAKDHGIPVGPGRGSGAGSLVAWSLGITDLDPIPYDLLFERFLNPERVSMPDFDIDFCMDRRDEVIDYVAAKYGRDRVSQIITYGTMAAKAVVRDTGRVLGFPYGFVDGVAKLIPMTLGVGLEDALGRTEKAQKDDAWRSDELIGRYEAEDDVRDLIDLALKLEDLPRNAGKHAGGVVISPSPLSDFCPLFAEHAGGGEGRNPVTQFDKDDVEAVGLVKFDFLGLRTLTIVDWAVKAINARKPRDETPLDITKLPLDDAKTYELFARGDTVAVFQFESRGMRELLKRALPDRFDDLIALVSLYRPGPMDLIPDFIERKHGRAEVKYPHPLLEPVLSPTYGVVVYQEQVMQTAQILAGYSLGGADLLRRAMGKKKPEEMAKERVKFEEGAKEHHHLESRVSGPIFDLLEKFAGYGFNKSHAAAYALVSYQTAWLKTHYPAEFMAAVLSSDMDKTEKVVGFLDEARTIGLAVLPPDVNASRYMFDAVDARTVRYGLGAVKGVGQNACEAIADERERGGPFTDMLDFCQRVDMTKLNRRAVEALVNAGAMDALGVNRPSLLAQLPEALKATEQQARERETGQDSLFGGGGSAAPTLRIELPEVADWPLSRKLDGERETLGTYLSGHPIDPYRDALKALVGHGLNDLDAIWANRSNEEKRGWRPEKTVVLAGQVIALRKRGESQAFVTLEDGAGRIEVMFFSEALTEYSALLTRDRILVIEGGLREDEFSGGYSLRARRCWDFELLCPNAARKLTVRMDMRVPGALQALDQAFAEHRPGSTPIRLEMLRDGARGAIDLDGSNAIRVSAGLAAALKAQPGVRGVALVLDKPWLQTRPDAG